MTTLTFPRALAATLGATLVLAAGTASAMTTTCADFMAMSPEDQMAEVAMMHDSMAADGMAAETTGDAMASDDAMATDDMAADSMATDGTMATDDAMAPAEGVADDMAADDAMASDDMAADTMASDEMTAIMAACDGNPDMMVMDVMPADAMAPATN